MNLDDAIKTNMDQLRTHAARIGFATEGTRADSEIELTRGNARIRLWTNQVHGEGRLIITITKAGRTTTRQISVRAGGERVYDTARRELDRIVRRATAVKP